MILAGSCKGRTEDKWLIYGVRGANTDAKYGVWLAWLTRLGQTARFRHSFWLVCFCVCLCVCVSVCLSVTFVHTGRTLAKIKNLKYDVCRFWHLPSNGIIAKLVLRDLDLHFLFQMFKICRICLLSYVAWQLKMWKTSAINNQTYAIDRRMSLFFPPLSWTTFSI